MTSIQLQTEKTVMERVGNGTKICVQNYAAHCMRLWNQFASEGPSQQSRRTSRRSSRNTGGRSSSADTVRVFVVDDHPAVRVGLHRLLASDPNVSVVGDAKSAEDCFKKLGTQTVDVVLMDINLPGMDGIQATRQLKSKHPDLKVIILSSFGDEYLKQAVQAGVDGYILKTASKFELVNAVVQAARGHSPIIDSNLTTDLLDKLTENRDIAPGNDKSDS